MYSLDIQENWYLDSREAGVQQLITWYIPRQKTYQYFINHSQNELQT